MDAQFIRVEISRLVDANPELAEDGDLRLDMIEGETDALRFIGKALSARQEAVSMQEAIKARVADLSERAARYGRKADAMKRLIKSVMQSADLDKLELPEATLSIAKPRSSVEVTDLDALPQGYFRLKKEADKTAIKKAIEAGEEIPGAVLSLGDESLMVRTK
jgi:hypothetical protein